MSIAIAEKLRKAAFYGLDAAKGGKFKEQLKQIEDTLSSRRNMEDFQERARRRLFEVASSSRRYAAISSDTPLAELPILSKEELRSEPTAFETLAAREPGLVHVSTSGSYGVPMQLALTPQKKARQQAEALYFGTWAQYDVGTSHLYLRSATPKSKLKLRLQNEWFSSTDNPSEEWIDEQLELLRNKRIRAIIGYPSTAALMASRSLAREINPRVYALNGVITIGESLSEKSRSVVEQGFGAVCLSRYSAEEVGTIAAECPEYKKHHVNEAGFIVEVLGMDSDSPVGVGELGRVVVTDLFSHAMPLIRYDIGDMAVLGADCACGRPTMVLDRIEGRIVEMLTDASGASLSPYFINPIMNNVEGVSRYQLAQTGSKDFELRVVMAGPDLPGRVLAHLKEKLGADSQIQIRRTEEIPALPSGKRPYVVNEWRVAK
ncbi:hypothetical protein M3F63_00035 [Brachybacterium muris]|uniref:phenylacetate--CoA ligase family protein n=1 Tax=Brachybacterium muris TaxID=219301 RepID=UPI00223B5769|nr:hypothetical protein [Brachybacterium muris]MCT2176069.1 hypothetical protein [Brachybacterium muris]